MPPTWRCATWRAPARTAIDRGLTQIVRDRLGDLATLTGYARRRVEHLRVLGPVLDRAATEIDAATPRCCAPTRQTDVALVRAAAMIDASTSCALP